MISTKTGQSYRGFSLPEILVATSIVGILSAISIPSFVNQMSKGKQGEAHSLITQVLAQTSAFNDEFGTPAEGWDDLDKMATIMTSGGRASGSDFSTINLPGGHYSLSGSRVGNRYEFKAAAIQGGGIAPSPDPGGPSSNSKYNIVACINVATGASDIQAGSGSFAATTENLKCP